MKEQNNFTLKTFMAIMTERDSAIRERNVALEERKRAFAERDMAMLQRDAALAEYNSAVKERDEAMANLRLKKNLINDNNSGHYLPGNEEVAHGAQSVHYEQQMNMPEAENTRRENLPNDGFQATNGPTVTIKLKKIKQAVENEDFAGTSVKSERLSYSEDESDREDISADTSNVCKSEHDWDVNENLDDQIGDWKDDWGLDQVNFDYSAMPTPVCSCTGVPQPCYKWGNGGWQSACCTTTMSVYPLPHVANKRYSRVGGRKMSGNAFSRLLGRLRHEGYDLSSPLDLKDHWAKRGRSRTNNVE